MENLAEVRAGLFIFNDNNNPFTVWFHTILKQLPFIFLVCPLLNLLDKRLYLQIQKLKD